MITELLYEPGDRGYREAKKDFKECTVKQLIYYL